MLLSAALLGALAALTAAQSDVLSFTRVPNPVTDGEANVLLWSTNDTHTPVEIMLQQGATSQLTNVTTLTKAGTGGQYIWNPATSLADGTDYRLLIIQGNQHNTYGPFVVQGANPAAVSSAAAASSRNATMTKTTMIASMGTGTAMHRNSTMSTPHLSTHHGTVTTTSKTSNTHPIASSSSGAAVADISTSSSSLALVLGAMAAIFCLH